MNVHKKLKSTDEINLCVGMVFFSYFSEMFIIVLNQIFLPETNKHFKIETIVSLSNWCTPICTFKYIPNVFKFAIHLLMSVFFNRWYAYRTVL